MLCEGRHSRPRGDGNGILPACHAHITVDAFEVSPYCSPWPNGPGGDRGKVPQGAETRKRLGLLGHFVSAQLGSSRARGELTARTSRLRKTASFGQQAASA